MVSEVQVDDERVARELLKVGAIDNYDNDGCIDELFRMTKECEEEEEDGGEEIDGGTFMLEPRPRR